MARVDRNLLTSHRGKDSSKTVFLWWCVSVLVLEVYSIMCTDMYCRVHLSCCCTHLSCTPVMLLCTPVMLLRTPVVYTCCANLQCTLVV